MPRRRRELTRCGSACDSPLTSVLSPEGRGRVLARCLAPPIGSRETRCRIVSDSPATVWPKTSPRQTRDPPNNLTTDPRRPKQSQDMSKTPQLSVLGSTAGLGADNSALQAFKMSKIQSLSNKWAARVSHAGYGHGHRSMQDGSSKNQNVSMTKG